MTLSFVAFFHGARQDFLGIVQGQCRFGTRPEPVLPARPRDHRRWQKDRVDRFFREDVRDLGAVRDLSLIEILADLLPDRVGSLLSINALREDLEVSHKAVSHWLDVLKHLYYVFRVPPFVAKQVRSIRLGARGSRT